MISNAQRQKMNLEVVKLSFAYCQMAEGCTGIIPVKPHPICASTAHDHVLQDALAFWLEDTRCRDDLCHLH